MRRALTLLLLFAVWLLAAPGAAAPRVPAGLATLSACDEARVDQAVQHVAPERAALRVGHAPLGARLPALLPLFARRRAQLIRGGGHAAPDLRAALRRVQTRRRVPRLSCEEPPWS